MSSLVLLGFVVSQIVMLNILSSKSQSITHTAQVHTSSAAFSMQEEGCYHFL